MIKASTITLIILTNMFARIIKRVAYIGAFLFCSVVSAQTTWNIAPGWNLLGNNSIGPLDVTYPGLSNPAQTNSIWTWNNATSRWAFFSPSLTSSELSAYAQSKGYDVLSSIASKQGFWIDAKTAFAVGSPWKNNAVLSLNEFPLGWNLAGVTEGKTPAQITQLYRNPLYGMGKEITSIWSWEKTSSNWKFYAPSLENAGGTTLADYISKRGYLPFPTASDISDGLWIRIQSLSTDPGLCVAPQNTIASGTAESSSTECAVPKRNYGDVTYPSTCTGTFPIPNPTDKLPPNIIRSIGFKDYYPGYLGLPEKCNDRTTFARNAYVETLDRLKALGAEQVWIYNYGTWDDFSKDIFTVAKADWAIPESEVTFIVSEATKRNIRVYQHWQFTGIDKKGRFPPDQTSQEWDAFIIKVMNTWRSHIVEQAKLAESIGIAGISADWQAFFVPNVSTTYRQYYLDSINAGIDSIRKVYSGKVVYGASWGEIIDNRILSKIDALLLNLGYWIDVPQEYSSISTSLYKSRMLDQIRDKANIPELRNSTIPVIWITGSTSKKDLGAWTEDGFCTNECEQLRLLTDFSIQSLVIEASFEALMEQRFFSTIGIDIENYWLTDDITPTYYPQFTYLQYAFPNLSPSIRNKPSEGIVKQWFKK